MYYWEVNVAKSPLGGKLIEVPRSLLCATHKF